MFNILEIKFPIAAVLLWRCYGAAVVLLWCYGAVVVLLWCFANSAGNFPRADFRGKKRSKT